MKRAATGLRAVTVTCGRHTPTAQEEGWLTVKRAAIISACLLVPTALATVIGMPVFDHYDETALIMLPLVAFFLATVISVPLMAEALHRRRAQAGERQRRPPFRYRKIGQNTLGYLAPA